MEKNKIDLFPDSLDYLSNCICNTNNDNNISYNDSINNNENDNINILNTDLQLTKRKESFTYLFNNIFKNSYNKKDLSNEDEHATFIDLIKKKTTNKPLKPKTSHTKIFIKSLLDLNLSSYEVNRISKLIKSFWISGIYSLLNKKLSYLFKEYKFKAEGFVFEFFYVKTSLIETDNTEENLAILNIKVKNLVLGNIPDHDKYQKYTINNNINNNKKLINFLNRIIVKNKKNYENKEKIILDILFILERNISFFIEAIWKDKDICNDLENEFQEFCNKDLLKTKFRKSKEIIKIIIKKVELEYPLELEIIKKYLFLKNGKKNLYLNNIMTLKRLEENNKIKLFINEIIEKILEISKKEKFESYFEKKTKKTKSKKG